MNKVFYLILLTPFILVASCNLWIYEAKKDRQYAEEYIRTNFEKYEGVELIKLVDSNEEFPLCCPEFAAELQIDDYLLGFNDLKVKSFDGSDGFLIWSVNGNRILCKSDHGYHQLGISAFDFPDAEYKKFNIKNIDDLIRNKDKLFKYFNNWPRSPENGIEVGSHYDSGNLSCYITKHRR